LEEARKYFERSLEIAKQNAEQDSEQSENYTVTTTYNLGRIYEALFMFEKAEKNYKSILTGIYLSNFFFFN